jgi:transcriptional regulator GlxA family with amidase domain
MPILIMSRLFFPFSIEIAPPGRGPKDKNIAFSDIACQAEGMRRSPKRVWFLVPPRTGLLNIAGPWEVLGHANEVLGRTAYALELVGPSAPAVETRHGLVVSGLRPLPKAGARLPDVAIVAGGSPLTPMPHAHARVASWLRRQHAGIPTIVSICTGAFVLGEAGLLDGRRATTHWLRLADLRARFPAAEVVDEGIFVRDGKVWTSAGITAGIDLTLALVEEDHGHGVAMAVAKRMVLFLRRSGNQAQFSSALQRQEKEPPKLRDLSTFVLDHVDEALPVERVAAGIGMSPRTLSRWCREHFDESPAELVRRLRIEEARRLLEVTSLPLKDITARTGLGDASTMWRAFTQRLGVTPAEYRQRFAAPPSMYLHNTISARALSSGS